MPDDALAPYLDAVERAPIALRELAVDALADHACRHTVYVLEAFEALVAMLRKPRLDPVATCADDIEADLAARDTAVARLHDLYVRTPSVLFGAGLTLADTHLGREAAFVGLQFAHAPLARATAVGRIVLRDCRLGGGPRVGQASRGGPPVRLLDGGMTSSVEVERCTWSDRLEIAATADSVEVWGCTAADLVLDGVHARRLEVVASDLGRVAIEGARVSGAVSLRGVSARRRIRLADLDGALDVEVVDSTSDELTLSGLRITGEVHVVRGTFGTLALHDTAVSGPVDLGGTVVDRTRWRRLTADALTVEGFAAVGGGSSSPWRASAVRLGLPPLGALHARSAMPDAPFLGPYGPCRPVRDGD
ncbi:hypothetical protein [Demequina gelatinilytica]|uniref:hypothetical protein n=1 Tax=Demequina gelatinilytica TaxID=1638980 RepID=UPI0007859136|nr:hypothetical protein [Demequina gelatinilytica]